MWDDYLAHPQRVVMTSDIDTFLRWTATCIQPCVHPDVRHTIDRDMHHVYESSPHVFVKWVSSFAVDVARTFPHDDPWLTGTTLRFDDIAPLITDDPRDDPETLPFAHPLSDEEQRAVLTACMMNYRKSVDVFATLPTAQSQLSALMYLIARRQSYVGLHDAWLMVEANERARDPRTTEPTWLDTVRHDMWSRLNDPSLMDSLIQRIVDEGDTL